MKEWLKNAVFYEVYPPSFYDSNGDGIGDILGITEKLDYIKELGADGIWINPCYCSMFMDGGYDVTDHKKIAPRYGTNENMCMLLEKAHKLGLKVILDLIPGHTSDQHPDFITSCQPVENDMWNRYIWTDDATYFYPNVKQMCGRYDRDGGYIINYFCTQPALNYGYATRQYSWQLSPEHPDCQKTVDNLIDIMQFWLDLGCDGFRVDMAGSLVKEDPEYRETIKLWQNVFSVVKKKYPDSIFLSEWFDSKASFEAGFDMDFYHTGGYFQLFRNHHGNRENTYFKDGKIDQFAKELPDLLNGIKNKGYLAVYSTNHDFARLAFEKDKELTKLALGIIFTLMGVPFLYYGDEIAMPYRKGMVSKEGGYYRTGSRTPMQWNADANAGFSSGNSLYLPIGEDYHTTNVATNIQEEDSVLNFTKELIKLRHNNLDFYSDISTELLLAEDGKPLVYRRGKSIVAVNPFDKYFELPFKIRGKVEMQNKNDAVRFLDKSVISPKSFCVIRSFDE